MTVRFLRRMPRPVAKRQAARRSGDLSAAASMADEPMSAVEVASGERGVLAGDPACVHAGNLTSASSGDAAQSADAACALKSIVGAGRRP
jgi:hypothetical protein